MKLFKKMFIAILVILTIFLGLKKYQPAMPTVSPQQCVFLIDEQLSAPFQAALQAYVGQRYQSYKDVEKVLQEVSCQFSEIQSMDAYVCKTDHLCFSFDACKPLFLLNEQIVCNNFQLVNKDHYHSDIVNNLFRVATPLLSDMDSFTPKKIADFVVHVPQDIFKEFDVSWDNDCEIILSQKNKKSDALVFSAAKIPTSEDIVLFKKIQAISKVRKNQMYDFRFKDQIIVK